MDETGSLITYEMARIQDQTNKVNVCFDWFNIVVHDL